MHLLWSLTFEKVPIGMLAGYGLQIHLRGGLQ